MISERVDNNDLNRKKMEFDFNKFRKDLISKRLSMIDTEKRKGMGLRDAAAECQLSASTLSRLELGRPPDIFTFAKLLTWIGKDANEYFKQKDHDTR